MSTIFRSITTCWPDLYPEPKRHLLFFGDRVELTRHFPCAWAAFSIDILTERGLACFHRTGLTVIGDGWRPVALRWILNSRLKSITIHAGFIGLVTVRFCPDSVERGIAALVSAQVKQEARRK